MPAIHDFRCDNCNKLHENEVEKPSVCESCGLPHLSYTFENWKKFNGMRDVKGENDLVDDAGRRRKFKASEDPTCLIELGLQEDRGIKTLSNEQSDYFRGRLLIDGDTPKLRKEILRERTKTLREQGIDTPDSM